MDSIRKITDGQASQPMIHILILHFNPTMLHKGLKYGNKVWTAWLGRPGLGLARLARLAALPGLGAGTLRVLSRARIYAGTEGFPSSGRNQ